MVNLARLEEVSGKLFDYVVIGGGTAGLTVAAQLSEDPTKSVLVLEAGGAHFDNVAFSLPSTYGKFIGNKEYDWGFVTIPQEHAENVTFSWPRPKVLGGGSAGNYYVWDRPEREDINSWERLGNPGWNWEIYLKYNMKAESFIPPPEDRAEAEQLTHEPTVHGQEGPVTVAFPPLRPGFEDIFADTLSKFGICRNPDPHTGNHVGVGMEPITVDPNTLRRVTSVSYLKAAGTRDNLHVLVEATVSRIISSSASGAEFVAEGVEFLVNGQTHSVFVASEVVVCAGSVQSPLVLELSGIGDPAILGKLGIETKVDHPAVGTNMQEHFHVAVSHELKTPERWNTIDALADPAVFEEQLRLLDERKGLLTIGASFVAMYPFQVISACLGNQEDTYPSGEGAPGLAEQYAEQRKRIEDGAACFEIVPEPGFIGGPNMPIPGEKYFAVAAIIQRPFSRGNIHASSTNPLDMPIIDPRYFEAEIDAQTLFKQLKFTRKILAAEPLCTILGREVNPGPEVQTDEELLAWLKKYSNTTWHTTSTCSMLPKDKGGVVDPRLKVYGTKNVRVADLSIAPLMPCGHTQSVAYTIGEIAADIIKGAFVPEKA